MKKTKKMAAILLSAIMLIVAYLPTSAIQEETDAYDFLLTQGFSENILDNLAEETDDWTGEGTNIMSASNQGGLGYITDLEEFVKYVGGNIAFMLVPTSPMYKGTTYSSNINVEYAHEYMPITGLDFSYGVGVGLSWDRGCDTMAASSLVRFSR